MLNVRQLVNIKFLIEFQMYSRDDATFKTRFYYVVVHWRKASEMNRTRGGLCSGNNLQYNARPSFT